MVIVEACTLQGFRTSDLWERVFGLSAAKVWGTLKFLGLVQGRTVVLKVTSGWAVEAVYFGLRLPEVWRVVPCLNGRLLLFFSMLVVAGIRVSFPVFLVRHTSM